MPGRKRVATSSSSSSSRSAHDALEEEKKSPTATKRKNTTPVVVAEEQTTSRGGLRSQAKRAKLEKEKQEEEEKKNRIAEKEEDEDEESQAVDEPEEEDYSDLDVKAIKGDSFLLKHLHEKSWLKALQNEFTKPYFKELDKFVANAYRASPGAIYPKQEDIFNALNTTPLHKVKCVIIGQDPYFNKGEAHGLCFSVQKGVAVPRSLNTIYHELEDDPEVKDFTRRPKHGYLESWAQQGVLMLNATLTVEHRKPNSHAKSGWQEFTDAVIKVVDEKLKGVVFMLWGGFAQRKCKILENETHHVLEAPHPSPMVRELLHSLSMV